MLIGFIGSPCSGKTTTAAMTFADLKNMGISCEYVPEQARLYIAACRLKSPPGKPVELSDLDQHSIMEEQSGLECLLVESTDPTTVVVADSSTLNALLYMSREAREWPSVKELIAESLKRYDILFYCGPVKPPPGTDHNRLHNEEQSLRIDRQIPEMLKEIAPDMEPVLLFGDSRQRHLEVVKTVLAWLVR